MDREKFKTELTNVLEHPTGVSDKDMADYIKIVRNKTAPLGTSMGDMVRGKRLLVAIEELSELQKELSKYLRFGDPDVTRYAILEELADVRIVLADIQHELGISNQELDAATEVKMYRNLDKINNLECGNLLP